MPEQVITITMGDVAENHVGMEQIGTKVLEGEGFNLKDLKEMKIKLKAIGITSKILTLKSPNAAEQKNAYILVAKNAVTKILNNHSPTNVVMSHSTMFNEQLKLDFDKKALMRGRVVNKHARWNLCYDIKASKPDYEKGKGRIIAYSSIPITKTLVDNLSTYFGDKAKNLKGEGNYYYDVGHNGISFHGDSERFKVIGIRLGSSLPLYFQWYHKHNRVGNKIRVDLDGGDIYVMSELAVGTNWKKSTLYTLRHATGASKYIA
jgi:alkylated DNA repair dioxygenase AlkB